MLQEFYATVTRKFTRQRTRAQIVLAMRSLRTLPTVQVSVDMIFSAVELEQKLRFSFWDSLILQAAFEAECSVLFSEDLQHGQKIHGLRIENPFL